MSFDCQLKLFRKAESERFLGLIQIDVLLVRIQSGKSGRCRRRRRSQRERSGRLRSPPRYGTPPSFKCSRECLTEWGVGQHRDRDVFPLPGWNSSCRRWSSEDAAFCWHSLAPRFAKHQCHFRSRSGPPDWRAPPTSPSLMAISRSKSGCYRCDR
jgi:hypothetical protein